MMTAVFLIMMAVILFTVLDRDTLKVLGVVFGVIAIGVVIVIRYNGMH